MKKLIDKFGTINTVISLICCFVFLLNNVLITKEALLNISDNLAVAYLLNFLAGCEGILGKWGSFSYTLAIKDLQLWRAITHVYLHAGVIHMVMNLAALLVAGKYVEKQLGSTRYLSVFNLIAILDAVIVCFIYTERNSVGASGGIFGIIGIALVMCIKKQIKFKKSEIIYLIVFTVISISPFLGNDVLVVHLLALIMGVLYGMVTIRNNTLNQA